MISTRAQGRARRDVNNMSFARNISKYNIVEHGFNHKQMYLPNWPIVME